MSVSKSFVLAGNSTFTIEVPEEKRPEGKAPHYTYSVERVEKSERWDESYFIRVLVGRDNTSDYAYLGKLDPFTGQVALTRKSAFPADSFRFRLLNRILARVWADDHAAYEQFGFRTHHEGKCGRCGRKLTVPSSIESGIGPECSKIMGISPAPKKRAEPEEESWEISERPDTDLSGLESKLAEEGEVMYWFGIRNGKKITVYND